MQDSSEASRFWEASRDLLFEQMVEKLNDGILLVGMDGDIIYANPALAQMLGYEPEQMEGATLFDFMDQTWADKARRALKRREKGVEEMFDHRWEHRDGSGVWTLVSAKPLFDEQDEQFASLVSLQDISQRKEMEQKLIQAREELENRVTARTRELRRANERLEQEVAERAEAEQRAQQASEAKSAFVANISHELRTPLNAVLGYSELLQEELARCEDPAELSIQQLRGDLDKIENAGAHLLDLINDILDLTKVEAGKLQLRSDTFEMRPLVEEVADTIRPRAAANGTDVAVDHGFCEQFVGDRTRLKQVLLNLAGNAAKFTPEGRIQIATRHDTNDGKPGVCIEISDTGIGMNQKEIERLFEPFVQADDSTSSEYGGTGLGLAICRRFVDRMGGGIDAKSTPGEGTTFTVWLAVAD